MSSFVPTFAALGTFSPSLLPPPEPPTPVSVESIDGETPVVSTGPSGPTEQEIADLIAAAEARGAATARAEMDAERATLQNRIQAVEALVEEVEETRRTDRRETRQLIGTLIISSMRRLIGEHPLLREAALRHAFAQAAAGMVGDRDVVLCVAPGQEEIARELIAERKGWTVRVNTELRAGLQAVSPRGRLDSSLMSALIAMEAAVNAWLEERP